MQYLRLLFGQRRRNDEKENMDHHADQVEYLQRKEKSSIANHPRNGNDEDIEMMRKKFCVRWIHSATLSFKQGELISVVGKPGAGKTTLLKILSGRLMSGCDHVSLH